MNYKRMYRADGTEIHDDEHILLVMVNERIITNGHSIVNVMLE